MSMNFATNVVVNTGNTLTVDGNLVVTANFAGATSSVAGSKGYVPAPSAGDNDKFLKGDGTWATAGGGGGGSSALAFSTAVSIPEAGTPVTYNVTGITANHQLIRWNFSASAENNPPASISWTTGSGTVTFTNNGGETDETMQPVFVETTAVTPTEVTP